VTIKDSYYTQLETTLQSVELGGEMKWIGATYFAEKDFNPKPSEHARSELNLEEEYSYAK